MTAFTTLPFDEQARFLTAKFGTAAGPTGLPMTNVASGAGLDLAGWMVVLGFLIFITLVVVLVRDAVTARTERHRVETLLRDIDA